VQRRAEEENAFESTRLFPFTPCTTDAYRGADQLLLDVYGSKQYLQAKQGLSSCTDFEEEESLLQSTGRVLSVLIDRTPECHCELAGEGIEYSWGCAKNRYRTEKLSEKRTKANFLKTVRMCVSQQVLTVARVRLFSKRARRYIMAYHTMHNVHIHDERPMETKEPKDLLAVTPMLIEKMVKTFKTHRCAMDFDHGFIQSIIKTDDDELRREVTALSMMAAANL
jgi:hypothetical protein